MTFRNKIFVLFCLCAICILPICSSAALPLVNFPLKPSPSEGPYQDTEFLEKANQGGGNLGLPISADRIKLNLDDNEIDEKNTIPPKTSSFNISPSDWKEIG